jgi:hypothetical protein
MFRVVLAYALIRGARNGLRGRTALVRSSSRYRFAYADGKHNDAPTIQWAVSRAGTTYLARAEYTVTRLLGASRDETRLVGG